MLIRISLTAALVAAGTLSFAGPASSAPAVERAAGPCGTGVAAVDRGGRVVDRWFEDKETVFDFRTPEKLPFKPVATSYLYSDKNEDGTYSTHYAMVRGDSKPFDVDIRFNEETGATSIHSVRRFKGSKVGARLIADSGAAGDFVLDRNGVLKRWKTFMNEQGQLYWKRPVVVRRGLGNLKTLGWAGRIDVGGVKADMLWGTTKAGALVQIQVPVKKVGSNKLIVVKKRGFRTTSGLALSVCNRAQTEASLIAVDKRNNRARWYTLRNQGHPKASNLVNHGRLGADLNWRLTAVF